MRGEHAGLRIVFDAVSNLRRVGTNCRRRDAFPPIPVAVCPALFEDIHQNAHVGAVEDQTGEAGLMVVLDEFQRCEVSASITCRSYDRERPSTRRDRPPVVTVLPRQLTSVLRSARSAAEVLTGTVQVTRSAPQSRTHRDQRRRRSPKMRLMCQLTGSMPTIGHRCRTSLTHSPLWPSAVKPAGCRSMAGPCCSSW